MSGQGIEIRHVLPFCIEIFEPHFRTLPWGQATPTRDAKSAQCIRHHGPRACRHEPRRGNASSSTR
eukprot:7138199-Alexandrium_andersonii.AAC.1